MESPIQNSNDVTMLNRFKCAGAIFLRGIIAPVTKPFVYVVRIDKARWLQSREGDFGRSAWDLGAKGRLNGDGFLIIGALITGTVAGTLVLAESLVESPYQLIRGTTPQCRPWLERRFNW